MAYDALRTIMPIAGWPEGRAREVEISVGADPVVPTGFASAPRGLLREGRAIPARDSTPRSSSHCRSTKRISTSPKTSPPRLSPSAS